MNNDVYNLMYKGLFLPLGMYFFSKSMLYKWIVYKTLLHHFHLLLQKLRNIIHTGIITSVNVIINGKCVSTCNYFTDWQIWIVYARYMQSTYFITPRCKCLSHPVHAYISYLTARCSQLSDSVISHDVWSKNWFILCLSSQAYLWGCSWRLLQHLLNPRQTFQ